MSTATLTKVGNSQAVIIPKKIREEAGYTEDTCLNIRSPRSGVIVITSIQEPDEDRRKKFEEMNKFIEEMSEKYPWPEGKTYDELLEEARYERAKERGYIF